VICWEGRWSPPQRVFRSSKGSASGCSLARGYDTVVQERKIRSVHSRTVERKKPHRTDGVAARSTGIFYDHFYIHVHGHGYVQKFSKDAYLLVQELHGWLPAETHIASAAGFGS